MSDYSEYNFSLDGTSIGGLPRSVNLPTGVTQSGTMSSTSKAIDCFAGQKFSSKLQAYLVGYVNSINSQYSVFD